MTRDVYYVVRLASLASVDQREMSQSKLGYCVACINVYYTLKVSGVLTNAVAECNVWSELKDSLVW